MQNGDENLMIKSKISAIVKKQLSILRLSQKVDIKMLLKL